MADTDGMGEVENCRCAAAVGPPACVPLLADRSSKAVSRPLSYVERDVPLVSGSESFPAECW